MSHTPGPWRQEGPNILAPSGKRLCWTAALELDIAHADARLIAAAPDLLAALEREHPKIVHMGFGVVGRADSGAMIHGPIDYGKGCETCAAIAKAKGES